MSEELKRGTRLGRYDLLLRIGRGGMATVWVARECAARPADERIVAIKAILADLADDDEFTNMFLDEGHLVERIRHPNVVELYEVGQHEGVMFMAMEWVEGESLHTLIAEAGKRRPIPPEMAVRIIADAAAGLHAAHETRDDRGDLLGVVHRDVSPHNILIGSAGQVKLVDFGVAKARARLTENTIAGQVKGKFGYMSPEQAVARPVDRRSDVFSLGIVLFELTTGRRLFRGDNDAETLSLVVQGEIPRPSAIDPRYPPALERIVLKALSRSRRERFQTARDFERALERFLKEERIVVPRAGIAALLKRVVGQRIEARRQSVRAALKALDSGDGQSLAYDDPALQQLAHDHDSVSGTSGFEVVSDPRGGNADSTGSFVGGPLSSTSGFAPSSSRGNWLGLAVGVFGIVVAIGAISLYLFGPPDPFGRAAPDPQPPIKASVTAPNRPGPSASLAAPAGAAPTAGGSGGARAR